MTLGQKVRAARKGMHTNQRMLASVCRIPLRRLQGIESGKINPDEAELQRLSKMLGLHRSELYTDPADVTYDLPTLQNDARLPVTLRVKDEGTDQVILLQVPACVIHPDCVGYTVRELLQQIGKDAAKAHGLKPHEVTWGWLMKSVPDSFFQKYNVAVERVDAACELVFEKNDTVLRPWER